MSLLPPKESTNGKAVTAAAIAVLGGLTLGLSDGVLHTVEVLYALALGAVSYTGTWSVRNRAVVQAVADALAPEPALEVVPSSPAPTVPIEVGAP